MPSPSYYVVCFVPGCTNTRISTPDKIFFNVPKGKAARKKWCSAVRRQDQLSSDSGNRCCQDHFNLDEDVANWVQYNVCKDAGLQCHLKLKKDVLPHIFDCQSDRKATHSKSVRSAVTKRQNQSLVSDALAEAELSAVATGDPDPEISEPMEVDATPELQPLPDDTSFRVSELIDMIPSPEIDVSDLYELNGKIVRDAGCQVEEEKELKETKEVGSQIKPHFRRIGIQVGAKLKTVKTSPIKFRSRKAKEDVTAEESEAEQSDSSLPPPSAFDESFTSYKEDDAASIASTRTIEECQQSYHKDFLLRINMQLMETHSKLYLGIEKEMLEVISLLQKFTKCSKKKIFIALRKIRKNESHEELGHIFCCDKSTISRAINSTIPTLAAFLGKFIFWPKPEVIQANVPIAFRAHYSKVQCIIDCFEIEIEKLANPKFQALTWSEYKKCNTVKYLVGCTPDGYISFISRGYGGRASDTQIFEDSGFLDILNTGVQVMADRGFKHVEDSLVEKGCTLIRPPSVDTGTEMTKDEVRETKLIASLRIHVERVINRIRAYGLLAPHACFHHDLLRIIDDAVIVACALCNLQTPIVH